MRELLKSIYKSIVPDKARLEINHLLFRLRALKYTGTTVTCNCCENQFARFLPFGITQREGAACPYCNSLERTRLLLFYLDRETSIFKKRNSVLHFAPEYSLEKRFKKLKEVDYISADIIPGLAMQKVDITAIKFPDERFDLIICSHVLMHVSDEEMAVSELYRVLKYGGSALVMTYIESQLEHTLEVPGLRSAEERLMQYGKPGVFRLHGKNFPDRLKRAGFRVEAIDYAKVLGSDISIKFGLGENEIIFRCTK